MALTNGAGDIDAETARGLAALGIPVRGEPIVRLDAEGPGLQRIVFAVGEPLERTVLFNRPRQEPRTALAMQLGCELVGEGANPGLIRVDGMQQTTVPGIFAAGDVATPVQSIAVAVSAGSVAAAMANHQLVHDALATHVIQE